MHVRFKVGIFHFTSQNILLYRAHANIAAK